MQGQVFLVSDTISNQRNFLEHKKKACGLKLQPARGESGQAKKGE